jgi:hypothetical protein
VPILKPNEKVLMGENTKFYNTQGYLTLTSRRLIFDHKPRGLGKERYTSIDMQLDGVIDAFVEGTRKKHLIVITKPGSFGKDATGRLEFSVRDPYSWQRKLIEIRKSIPDTQTTQQSTGWICPACATLNASDLPKCSRCGELNPR